MMQLKQISSVILGISLCSYACAAHLSEPANTASYNWTGIYAGLNLGVVKHTISITDNQAATFNATIQQVTNPRFSGGLQLGVRHQLEPKSVSGVYGAELSFNFSNATSYQEYGSPFALYQLSSKNALKDVGLMQLIGGIAADKTFAFLAAGLSWTKTTGTVLNQAGLPFFNSFNIGSNSLGTAIGGGIEYALTEKISARFKVDVITSNAYSTFDNAGNNYQVSNNSVQGTLGINYRFV